MIREIKHTLSEILYLVAEYAEFVRGKNKIDLIFCFKLI